MAAQEVLQRLAPDLTAQISAILRAYSKPQPSLTSAPVAAATLATGKPSVTSQAKSPAAGPHHISFAATLTQADSIPAEDSQALLLMPSAHVSSENTHRRGILHTHLPTVSSNVPMEQLDTYTLAEAAEAATTQGQMPVTSPASLRAQAMQLQQQLLQEVKQGRLVMLGAAETLQQTSYFVVMKGSIRLQGQPITGALAPGVCTAD